jgi:hypothetical protein
MTLPWMVILDPLPPLFHPASIQSPPQPHHPMHHQRYDYIFYCPYRVGHETYPLGLIAKKRPQLTSLRAFVKLV